MQKLSILLCLCCLFACNKPGHDVNLPCNCDAESFYATYGQAGSNVFDRPYKFRKTYNADGSIKTLYIRAAFTTIRDYNGYVKKTGNLIYMLDSVRLDTIMKAEINSKNQVVRSTVTDWGSSPNPTEMLTWQYYIYNSRNQLISFGRDSTISDSYNISYDAYGNMSKFNSTKHPETAVTFTYDYNTPIKGAEYFIDGYYTAFLDLEILKALGYIDLTPHHKMLTAVNPDFYPPYNRTFINQVINADGYVTSYGTTVWYGRDPIITTTNWHCKNTSHYNY